MNEKKSNPWALIPILVFIVIYLGLGITFEYGMGIEMGFYNIPVTVAFLIAIMVACFMHPKEKFSPKLDRMAEGVGDKGVVAMILIFLLAGVFVGTLGRTSAESVAYFMLSIIPSQYAIAVIFVVACFVSTAMGTSVGTITLITPIAITMAQAAGFDLPLTVATVIGGAMFGDNLSFISDTTIVACQGQGCEMKDKFRENFKIALPAALATLILICILTVGKGSAVIDIPEYSLIQMIPYLLVLIGGIVGFNVYKVLLLGIISGVIIMLATGATTAYEMICNMGSGASGMFETSMVAIEVAALCALIRDDGGLEALLNGIKKIFKGKKLGQLGIGLLVGFMDVSTANNTVAIVMANPIAKEMADDYAITNKKTASLLDTFSCIFQGVIPYGAQILVALAACSELGVKISAFDIIPNLFYQYALLISSLIFIFIIGDKKLKKKSKKKIEEKVGE